MAMNQFEMVDYLEEARSRVTSAWEGKVVFDKYVQLLIHAQTELASVFRDLMQLRSIDTATGEQLNIIGRIVGQERVLLNTDLYEFFGFLGTDRVQGFGELGDTSYGAPFAEYGKPLGGNVELNDDTYRLFIKAKIYKNSTASTPEEFIRLMNLLFNAPTTYVYEQGNANLVVLIGRELTYQEKQLLNYKDESGDYVSRLIPKTVGVGIGFGEFDADQFFGFQDTPNAKGFGELYGTYGYGLGYGLKYGDSDYGYITTWDSLYDGSEEYDGGSTFSATPTLIEGTSIGGKFASLY